MTQQLKYPEKKQTSETKSKDGGIFNKSKNSQNQIGAAIKTDGLAQYTPNCENIHVPDKNISQNKKKSDEKSLFFFSNPKRCRK